MMTFLEYLKEYEKQLKEDAIMAANTASSSGAEVTSPKAASQSIRAADIVSSTDAAIPMTDNSVLGATSKKKDCGFFGKDNFQIPQNVLSGEVERRIETK